MKRIVLFWYYFNTQSTETLMKLAEVRGLSTAEDAIYSLVDDLIEDDISDKYYLKILNNYYNKVTIINNICNSQGLEYEQAEIIYNTADEYGVIG